MTKEATTLSIEYMRCSHELGDYLFIGTEERMLYMIETNTLNVLEKINTQSYVFTILAIDHQTLVLGEYQGFIEVIRFSKSHILSRLQSSQVFSSSVYKAINSDPMAFACGDGLYFGHFSGNKYTLKLED